jgi:hypothetical protein
VRRSAPWEFPTGFLELGPGNKTVLVLFLKMGLVTPEDRSENKGAHNQEEAAQTFETEAERQFLLPPGKKPDQQDGEKKGEGATQHGDGEDEGKGQAVAAESFPESAEREKHDAERSYTARAALKTLS